MPFFERVSRVLGALSLIKNGTLLYQNTDHQSDAGKSRTAVSISSNDDHIIHSLDSDLPFPGPYERNLVLGRDRRWKLLSLYDAMESAEKPKSKKLTSHTHCACRVYPETISFYTNLFDMLVKHGRRQDDVIEGYFHCSEMKKWQEDDKGKWVKEPTNTPIDEGDSSESEFHEDGYSPMPQATSGKLWLPHAPDMFTCYPHEILNRLACAHVRPELWEDIALMMRFAADCFDSTPFTGAFGPTAAEVLASIHRKQWWGMRHYSQRGNWPTNGNHLGIIAGDAGSTTAMAADALVASNHDQAHAYFVSPQSFARPECRIPSLPRFCIEGSEITLDLSDEKFFGETITEGKRDDLWLAACPDSYGEYRRVSGVSDPNYFTTKMENTGSGRAILVRIGQAATENLWHALHFLGPLAVDLREEDTLIIDCVSNFDGLRYCKEDAPFMNGFLPLLTNKRVLWLPFAEKTCFPRNGQWGLDHLTLFGRDKGSWRGIKTAFVGRVNAKWSQSTQSIVDLRQNPKSFTHLPLKDENRNRIKLPHSVESNYKKPKLVFVTRSEDAKSRRITNIEELETFIDTKLSKFYDVRLVDFSKVSIREQYELAKDSVLVGIHGQALSWSPFAKVCVEIMPYMSKLKQELCRPGWGATPMYAYGGTSLVFGVPHVCLLGRYESQFQNADIWREINYWISRDVNVDIDELERILITELRLNEPDLNKPDLGVGKNSEVGKLDGDRYLEHYTMEEDSLREESEFISDL